ncbi:hypothetical protein FA13DRAFT_1734120 [Coprinellus micaceus]|uniref:Uncharacterized protein n=1 Tax=Coprinellus micaceus TaxID=71717 RepID=A0A4Y7T752_COPMI|nr:hypothetical protein FA13DRAFT_1734120 [Coprinellus micaceus]
MARPQTVVGPGASLIVILGVLVPRRWSAPALFLHSPHATSGAHLGSHLATPHCTLANLNDDATLDLSQGRGLHRHAGNVTAWVLGYIRFPFGSVRGPLDLPLLRSNSLLERSRNLLFKGSALLFNISSEWGLHIEPLLLGLWSSPARSR